MTPHCLETESCVLHSSLSKDRVCFSGAGLTYVVLSGLFPVPAAVASLRGSPALLTSLTHTSTMRFWPNWNHLGRGRLLLGLMWWTWAAVATGGEKARPSRGIRPPTESTLVGAGWYCCLRCGEGGVEEPRASQTSNGRLLQLPPRPAVRTWTQRSLI